MTLLPPLPCLTLSSTSCTASTTLTHLWRFARHPILASTRLPVVVPPSSVLILSVASSLWSLSLRLFSCVNVFRLRSLTFRTFTTVGISGFSEITSSLSFPTLLSVSLETPAPPCSPCLFVLAARKLSWRLSLLMILSPLVTPTFRLTQHSSPLPSLLPWHSLPRALGVTAISLLGADSQLLALGTSAPLRRRCCSVERMLPTIFPKRFLLLAPLVTCSVR
mmetsp:Transcript_14840/g.36036  ORF Transcript_14840/g.36036 Transcript_14840/m.36036 type:complete len:221 (+) Transcript_14840:1840-2502(+)